MNIKGDRHRFLWVKLQIERLCREKIEDDVMIALENHLPEDLDQLYQESLSHIFKSGMTARDAAVRIFSWILHMREPLTPSALLTAVSNGQKSTMQLSELMALCANLVVLDKNCHVIRFAHRSVKEFLERNDAFTGAVAHSLLASTCIEVCSRGPVFESSLKYPSDDFYVYAAIYWPVHSNMAEGMAANKDIVNDLTSFIFDEDFDTTLSFDSWLETRGEIVSILANHHAMKAALDAIPNGGAGFLFLVSVFGLTSLLRKVLEHVADLDINQKNKHSHTPIYLAAAFGHSAALSLLADLGADVNVQGGKYGSPLHAACFAGHLEAVQTLLKLDANISCGVLFDDAFQAACRGGQERVAFLLIDSGCIVKSEDDYEKALEAAARAGFVDVVHKLQEPPFLPFNDSKLDKVRKKTKKAIQGGQLGVIRQFLDQQPERRDVLPVDAVALATLYNHRTIVEFLIEEGLSVEAEGAFGTPLRTACLLNYQPIARLLLHRGAHINADGTFGAALQAAAMKGHTMCVRVLIDEGANVNQQSGLYGTALQAAAYHGQHCAVGLLLDVGANVHAKGYSRDAFHAACEGGHQEVIMLLLRKGYEFYHQMVLASSTRARTDPSQRYRALVRDASPGRVPGPYRQGEPSRVSRVVSVNKRRPITELKDIFRVAEQDSEIARVHSEENPTAGYRPRSHLRHRKNYPLEAAASAGHEGSVKLLLEQREVLGILEDEISNAIKVATTNSHWLVVQPLLEYVAERQSVKSHIESIFEILCQRRQSPMVDLALAQVSKYCSADEIAELKQRIVVAAENNHYEPGVSHETLILDFEKGCKFGNVRVIDAILASKHHEALSPREMDAGIQLCVLNDQSTVVSMLLEAPSLKGRLPPSGEKAFVVAAGGGSVQMMKLLTSYGTEELTTTSSDAITRALVVACENGHIDVVRYLVEHTAADINTLARDRHTVVPVISPLQAALRGFCKLNDSRKADRFQHEEVIVFLLGNGSKLNDLGGQNLYPIQLAVMFCPVHIVEKLIAANADVNASNDGKSALFAAAGRELSAAPIVRKLLAAGATIPKETEKQKALLNKALRYFEGNTLDFDYFFSLDDPDGRFLVAPSLEYVFNEGSGAVLFEFLHLMPEITTTDIRWTLVLQMAALLDDHPFVDLLLSRGTDVNAIGHYYGTALQAAARYGHINMVQKLLDAGADVNVFATRLQTALGAAIVGGHEDVVETLLSHGADMELSHTRWQLYRNSDDTLDNALQMGVQSGTLSIVKILLKHGANAVHAGTGNLHPLILASKQGSVTIVNELLEFGAPVNLPAKKQRYQAQLRAEDASPMHAAVAGGHLDVIEVLLSQGADIETNVKGSGTPLSLAASKGRADIVRLLLSAGANAIDGAALHDAVRKGNIEITQELLAAGSKAEPVLALACRQGFLPVLELLLERVYDGEKLETVIDEVFAIHGLDDSVFRLLLDYAQATIIGFFRVCAGSSVALVQIILEQGGIDVNGQTEANGDYPLHVAALQLQVEVAQFLLISGADVNCKSAKHGTPLITALEACAASKLRTLKSEKAKESMDQLFLPNQGRITYNDYYGSCPSRFQQISDCEHIVQLLINHGANIADESRPFGSPIHLACLIGSEGLVELLLEKGADLNTTAGFFEKVIFAAIQGDNPGIVKLLLQKTPLINYLHPDFATPLHFACANGYIAPIRKLLEHGADATVLDAKGRTPLTISLENGRQPGFSFGHSQTERPLEIILKLANPIRVVNDDLVKAAQLGYRDAEKTIALLLDVAKDLTVSEAAMCHVLESPEVNNQVIHLLMQRKGGIGVTANMLTAVRNHDHLTELLKHRPVCRITPEILKSQKELKCMELLMEIDPQIPVTDEVLLRALEIGNVSNRRNRLPKQEGKEVLETLLDRSPDIAISKEMLQAVRLAADMEILLKYDPSIKLDADMVLHMIPFHDAIDTLEMFLEHDPSMPVTEKFFLRVFQSLRKSDREKLADLMHRYAKRLVFTYKVREMIDHAYQSKSETATKEQFYKLRVIDEDDIELVNDSKDEKTSPRK